MSYGYYPYAKATVKATKFHRSIRGLSRPRSSSAPWLAFRQHVSARLITARKVLYDDLMRRAGDWGGGRKARILGQSEIDGDLLRGPAGRSAAMICSSPAQAVALGHTIVTDNEREFARIDGFPREKWLGEA